MKPANSRRGGVISGLLAAALVLFLVMTLAGVVVTRSIHVHSADGRDGTDVSIDTPGGRLAIRSRENMDPAIVGIPIYPGAWSTKDSGGAHIEWTSADGHKDNNLYAIGGEFRTKDPAWKVVDYYRDQLPSLMIVSEEDSNTRLEYKKGGIKRIISITEEDGETRIGFASVGGRESN